MANLHSRKNRALLAEEVAPSTLCHDCCWVLQLFKTLRVHTLTPACVREPCGQGFVKRVVEGAKGRRQRLWSRARAQACSLRGRVQQMDRGGGQTINNCC